MTTRRWIVIIGIIIAVGGFAFWLGQRDTVRLTSADKEITQEIEAGTLTSDDLESAAQQGIAEYEKITGGKSAQSAAPTASEAELPPIKNTWKVQAGAGTLTFVYRETESAKGKILVDIKDNILIIQNLSDHRIDFMGYELFDGERSEPEAYYLDAKDDFRWDFNQSGKGKMEMWFEVSR